MEEVKKIKLEVKNCISLLLKHAYTDSGGGRNCAMFLLSLWDGSVYKADLQEVLYNDASIFSAMITLLKYLYGSNTQLDRFVTQDEMNPVLAIWGKQFKAKSE